MRVSLEYYKHTIMYALCAVEAAPFFNFLLL